MLGKSMTDPAGRLKLAEQLRDLADRFDEARAIASDAAKVLQSDADREIAVQEKWEKLRAKR